MSRTPHRRNGRHSSSIKPPITCILGPSACPANTCSRPTLLVRHLNGEYLVLQVSTSALEVPYTTALMHASSIAPPHMAQGRCVEYITERWRMRRSPHIPPVLHRASLLCRASLSASISAWANGLFNPVWVVNPVE